MRKRLRLSPQAQVPQDFLHDHTLVNHGNDAHYVLADWRKELIRWILSWTPDVEVLAPEELKTRIAEKLRQGLETAVSSCPPILA